MSHPIAFYIMISGYQESCEWNVAEESVETAADEASSLVPQRNGQRPRLRTEHNTSHTRRHRRPQGTSRVLTRRN